MAAQKQHFNGYAGILLHAQQTRRDNLRFVDDKRVAGVEVINDIVKMLMLQRAVLAVDNHQAAVIARLHRLLRDQLLREKVVEVRGFQGGILL